MVQYLADSLTAFQRSRQCQNNHLCHHEEEEHHHSVLNHCGDIADLKMSGADSSTAEPVYDHDKEVDTKEGFQCGFRNFNTNLIVCLPFFFVFAAVQSAIFQLLKTDKTHFRTIEQGFSSPADPRDSTGRHGSRLPHGQLTALPFTVRCPANACSCKHGSRLPGVSHKKGVLHWFAAHLFSLLIYLYAWFFV